MPAQIQWYVKTDKVGSKMTGTIPLTEDFYRIREDGTTEIDESYVMEVVWEHVAQAVKWDWTITEEEQ